MFSLFMFKCSVFFKYVSTGTVIDLVSGVDGQEGAVYRIEYDGESDAFEVDHLIHDFTEGSVKILD